MTPDDQVHVDTERGRFVISVENGSLCIAEADDQPIKVKTVNRSTSLQVSA